ncbi:membrane protein [Hallella multisaccharivorax DSM 17128]|nr:membrane protein [Hallella multisaccharivorax DSM 17128]
MAGVLFGGLLLASCNDFLEERPQSDFTAEATVSDSIVSKYNTIADARAELQGAYNSFKNDIFQQENYMINDVQSDNCYVGGDGTNEAAVDIFKLSATNAKVALVWSQYMAMAGNATNVIENVRLMKGGASDKGLQEVMAEAKFIRAWALFDMVRLYGDLPLVLQLIPTITAENLDTWYPVMYPKRSSVEEVYQQIFKDLDATTIAALPSKNAGAFQATKGAAYGLLAKVYATYKAKGDRDYKKVVEYCDKVMAQGYQLVGNFDDLWNPDNKFTSESIFEVYYTTESPNWAYWTLLKEDDGSVTWRRYCTPTHELVSKFLPNDKRFAASIQWKKAPYDAYWNADNYPFSYKIREKNSDIILMRLADIMLLKAEALVELGQTAEAIGIVNKIRERAGLSSNLLNTAMPQAEARKAVENERQLELYMEGQRWYDLLRNDRALEVMRVHKDRNGNRLFPDLKSFRVLWPVPQSELDKNTNLKQNEGY